jgi:hypothetical protein
MLRFRQHRIRTEAHQGSRWWRLGVSHASWQQTSDEEQRKKTGVFHGPKFRPEFRNSVTKLRPLEGQRPMGAEASSCYLASVNLILTIVVLLLLFGGGGFYLGGPAIGGGGLGLVLLICLIIFFMGGFRAKN